MKYKVFRDGVVIADGLTEPRFEDFDADPNKDHVYDVVVYETYDVSRNGEYLDTVEVKTFTDNNAAPDTEYTYTVEITGVENSEASVTTTTLESGGASSDVNLFVSNKELVWDDLPARGQEDNGSLELVRRVEGGFIYQANFEWDNGLDPDDPAKNPLNWLVDVLSFKDNKLRNGNAAFYSMPAAQITALPDLDTSNIVSMAFMFYDAKNFNQSLDNFDTSNVLAMNGMFRNASSFDQPLNHFKTSNVVSLNSMFDGAEVFNQPLSNWDTSSVTNMGIMFYGVKNFDQDLNNWDTSSVTSMTYMFASAKSFNHPLTNWDTSNVDNMSQMFHDASAFDQPLNHFNTSNVTNMASMFNFATNFNQPLTDWDTGKVTDMESMFSSTLKFNQDLSGWCVEKIPEKPQGFDHLAYIYDQDDKQPCWGECGCPPPTTTILVSSRRLVWNDLPAYNQSNNSSLKLLSSGDGTFTYEADFDWDNSWNPPREMTWLVDVLQFKNNQLKSGVWAFNQMTSAERLTALPKLDTSNLTDMRFMFENAWKFNQPLNHFDTSNVTDMRNMFKYGAFNHPLDNWDTSKVTNMNYLFYNAPFDQDISGWCVSQISQEPVNFGGSSGFKEQDEKQPKWGQPCNTVSEAQVVEEPKPEPTPEPTPKPIPAPRRRKRRGKRRRR